MRHGRLPLVRGEREMGGETGKGGEELLGRIIEMV